MSFSRRCWWEPWLISLSTRTSTASSSAMVYRCVCGMAYLPFGLIVAPASPPFGLEWCCTGLESDWEVRMDLDRTQFLDHCFVVLIVVVFAYLFISLFSFAWLR